MIQSRSCDRHSSVDGIVSTSCVGTKMAEYFEISHSTLKDTEGPDPNLVIGSPPRAESSPKGVVAYIRCPFDVYDRRMQRDKHFLHEHQCRTRSWDVESVHTLFSRQDIFLKVVKSSAKQ